MEWWPSEWSVLIGTTQCAIDVLFSNCRFQYLFFPKMNSTHPRWLCLRLEECDYRIGRDLGRSSSIINIFFDCALKHYKWINTTNTNRDSIQSQTKITFTNVEKKKHENSSERRKWVPKNLPFISTCELVK